MQIAILAPSAVPFAIGGAERLCWALHAWINDNTPHQAELIRLPCAEHDFWSVVESYRSFSRLDVSHFDCVISTKYPSWMVRHPRHVCYMLHRLRGLYDAYRFFSLDERVDYPEPRIRELQSHMRKHPGDRAGLEEAFALLEAIRAHSDPADAPFAFPGPLAREVVHYLDDIGLAAQAVTRFAAISATVAARKSYFPAGAKVEVAHPPPQATGHHCRGSEHLFTVSRLDTPKRIDLLIEAMRYVQAPVPLRIAGGGPEAARLKSLAALDSRISMLGYISDAQALDEFADAFAVPFVPYDEDFGLVTLEAMLSAKPVITVEDAGGPRELVEHGVTGLVTAPEPRALAGAIETLWADRDAAARMGLSGRQRAQTVTWDRVVETLLGETGSSHPSRPARKSLAVALSFPVFPPRGGGQTRAFHLYRHVARTHDVTLVTLGGAGDAHSQVEIAPGLTEIRVPKSRSHQALEAGISAKVDWVPVTDVCLPRLHTQTPGYGEAIGRSARAARAVIACHPYAYPAIRAATNAPVWYEAQDVEFALKRSILPATPAGERLLKETREVEAECYGRSEVVFTCTREDGYALREAYGPPGNRLLVVPNGVDLDSVRHVVPEERARIKASLGLDGWRVALFLASWHGPNLQAAEFVLDAAKELDDHLFLIVGSACLALAARAIPDNVKLLGVVDDETKALLLGAADVALNPMQQGSGSNLKILDYMAAGVPVITSAFGARGIPGSDGLLVVAEPEALADALRATASDQDGLHARARAAREHVERQFCWESIAARFLAAIDA